VNPEDLDPETHADLLAYLARVKHDLGRYVALQQRWLPAEATAAERRAAVEADLLQTRRGPEGTLDAASLWAALRAPLLGLAPLPGGGRVDLARDPDVERIEAGITEIQGVVQAFREGEADGEAVERGAAAARVVSEACRGLVRRWRSGRS